MAFGIGEILGGLGAIKGIFDGNKAEKEASKARKSAQRIDDRAVKLWDVLFANADQAAKGGAFDPERRIAQLEKDTAHYESRDLGNLAGAMRVAGYRPGDSEIGTRLDAVKGKYRRFLDTMRDDIRRESVFDVANIYATASPNYLAGAASGARNDANTALASAPNPAGFLQSVMPFFNQPKQTGFKSGLTPPDKTNPFWR